MSKLSMAIGALEAWERSKPEGPGLAALLLRISAARLKFSAGELELLERLAKKFPKAEEPAPRAGLYLGVEGESARTLNSLASKGLWARQGADEVQLKALGAVVLARTAAAAASAGARP